MDEIKCICACDTQYHTLVFCFRGTEGTWSNFQNLNAQRTTQIAPNVSVFSTLYDSLNNHRMPALIAAQIRAHFLRCDGLLRNVVYIGHSRGGAQALILHTLFQQDFHRYLGNDETAVQVVNLNHQAIVFGSPLVLSGPPGLGNHKFVQNIHSSTTFFVNDDDMIPRALGTVHSDAFRQKIRAYPLLKLSGPSGLSI